MRIMSTDLDYFVKELITSDLRKRAGEPWPWSENPIIRDGKFCRPRVEDDRTSRAIARCWRDPNADDPDLVVAIAIAKRLNNAEAIEALGYPLPDLDAFYAKLIARHESGEPCMNQGAYNAIGGGCPKGMPAVIWFTKTIFPALWATRDSIRPRDGDSCADVYERLTTLKGWGKSEGLSSFLSAQVVNCLKYVGPLRHASDFKTFAVSGPGSRPGLKLALGRPPDEKWNSEAEWRDKFDEINAGVIQPEAQCLGVELTAADSQSILCEHSKFVKWTVAGNPGRCYKPPHLRTTKAPKKRKAKPSAPILDPALLPSAPPAPPVTYVPRPDAPTLFVDVETRSTAQLDDVGAWRYAADPTTEILCLSYAVDAGPVQIWLPGQPIPQVFFEAARDPRWRVVAHNAQFECAILEHVLVARHGWPVIPLERWRCTMAMALAGALPGKLENVAVALDLSHRKDVEGHQLMLQMCKPLYIEARTNRHGLKARSAFSGSPTIAAAMSMPNALYSSDCHRSRMPSKRYGFSTRSSTSVDSISTASWRKPRARLRNASKV